MTSLGNRRLAFSRWRVIALAAACVTAAVGAVVASRPEPPPLAAQSPTRPAPVAAVRVERTPQFQRRRAYTGVIAARRETTLSFERSGKVVELLVDEGDAVEAGQVLARLDTRHLEVKRREAQARRREAAARLKELEAGPREESIAAARAEVRNLQAQLELSQANLRRGKGLREHNTISVEQYDRLLHSQRTAEAQLDAAQCRLDELLAGTREEQIAAQEAVLAQCEAALDDLEADLEDCALPAPFAGTIAERRVDEGAVLSPGTPVFRIMESGQLEARVGLPPSAATKLKAEQSYRLICGNTAMNASVRAVLPDVDPATRTRMAIFTLDESPAAAAPGRVVRLELVELVATSGFWLPTAALARSDRGLWSVFVADDQGSGVATVSRRDVEMVHAQEDRAFVRGLIAEGDRVVAGGVHRIVDRQRVTVAREVSYDSLASPAHDQP